MDEWVRSYRQVTLGLILAAAFTEGLVMSQSVATRSLVALTLASSITLWSGLDARLHGKVFLRSFGWVMMLTWPIGVAVHLVWTRGARGILTYAVASLACVAAAGGGLAIGALLVAR